MLAQPWIRVMVALAAGMAGLCAAGCEVEGPLYGPFETLPVSVDFPDPISPLLILSEAGHFAAVELGQRLREQQTPRRQLTAIRGHLLDNHGIALNAGTIEVRRAACYSAVPETLPVQQVEVGRDGTFAVAVGDAEAICLDFQSPGCRPLRRWYVVLTPGVEKRLPEDFREFEGLSPECDTTTDMAVSLVRQ